MPSAYLPSSGITAAHFRVFQTVASRPTRPRIIVVRNTNIKSTPWIDKGYPPKPKVLEPLHTDEKTGKVTATDVAQIAMARSSGFYVIDQDGVARRNPADALSKRFPFNTADVNALGQVIEPGSQLAFVGDYDLMGVIDPKATGRTITLVASNGIPVENRSNPDVAQTINDLNALMDRPRVMHGPQDLYKSFRGGCTAFLPDSNVEELLTEAKVREFYEKIKRQTITGSYRSGA
ncbi:MAG TPA: hypothetical protein VNU84_05875 [Candidatus Acidoferrum sp.]|jgi:hypothetical protein|nr:hypothetical protein [Candidatus Acidoferrum sp.]